MFDLSDKIAVIPGGHSGIGYTAAEALAEAGANVVISARRLERCQEACLNVEKLGVKCLPVRCDVKDTGSVDDLVETVMREFGRIDILVNSAGISGDIKRVTDMSLENWDSVMNVDLTGTFLCCGAVARVMVKQNSGKIINIASASSFKAMVGMAAYSAAKAGVVMLTKTLALELARYNVQANTLSPGYFITALNKDFFDSEAGQKMISMWPMRRPGNLEELRGIIVYLGSSASSYTTGTEILIDGGQWL
jgi:gluconate 5-dehydrogenase